MKINLTKRVHFTASVLVMQTMLRGLNTTMQSFRDFIREMSFKDLTPRPNTWTKIPVATMKAAQTEPTPNIDTELFDLISKAYAYMGGHVDFQKPADLPGDHMLWYGIDIDRDQMPDALKFGKMSATGTKWTGMATNGSHDAKREVVQSLVTSLKTRGHYSEMSGKIAHLLLTQYQVPWVSTQQEVERAIGKTVEWIGHHPEGKYPGVTGFYRRMLAGHPHVKILLGTPK